MTKQELEQRLHYEITNDGWKQLESMYMACDLDKKHFADLVRSGAKVYKVQKPIKTAICRGVKIELNEYVGMYEIKDVELSLIQKFFDTVDEAKIFVERYRG